MSKYHFDKPVHLYELHYIEPNGNSVDFLQKVKSHETALSGVQSSVSLTALQTRVTTLENTASSSSNVAALEARILVLETYITKLQSTYTIVEP